MDHHPEPGELGTLLRRYRVHAGLTQQQLADVSTVSIRAIRDLEAGRAQRPRRDTLRLLAEGLRLDPRWRTLLEIAAGREGDARRLAALLDAAAPTAPAPLSLLIGREREVAALVSLLRLGERRLIKLVGIGGVGKTRVALEAARVLRSEHGRHVLWVAFEQARQRATGMYSDATPFALLASWVSGRLARSEDQIPRLATLFERRQCVLVLDGCDDSARLWPQITRLLHLCPRLTVLVTSRQPNRTDAEHILPLGPLPTPEGDRYTGGAFAEVASVRLLLSHVDRLRSAQHGNPATAGVIADICRLLDGVPRAIETVASWLVVRSPGQLLQQLRHNLLDLSEPSPTGTRFDTRDALRYAFEGLTDAAEHRVLDGLVDRDTAVSAEQLAELTGDSVSMTDAALHSLVVRGLACRLDDVDDVVRFRALNLVRTIRRDTH